jgi:hypothetical protein
MASGTNRFEFRVTVDTNIFEPKIIAKYMRAALVQGFPGAVVAVHDMGVGKMARRRMLVRDWMKRQGFVADTDWIRAAKLAKAAGLYSNNTYNDDIAMRLRRQFERGL